jgi:hypothetical protein
MVPGPQPQSSRDMPGARNGSMNAPLVSARRRDTKLTAAGL